MPFAALLHPRCAEARGCLLAPTPCDERVERVADARGPLLHRARAVDLEQHAPITVEVEQRLCVLLVDGEAPADGVLGVVGAPGAPPPLQQAAHELVLGYVERDDGMERAIVRPSP